MVSLAADDRLTVKGTFDARGTCRDLFGRIQRCGASSSGAKIPGHAGPGDTLHNLAGIAAAALAATEPDSEQYRELKALADDLRGHVDFYGQVLTEHGIDLPFYNGLPDDDVSRPQMES